MTDVVILGIGIHPFGRFDPSYQAMGSLAASNALKDAGVDWQDIQFAYLSRMYLPATSGARILKTLGCTGIPIVDIEAACASGGAALRQAVLAIRSGEADLGLVLGAEKMPRGETENENQSPERGRQADVFGDEAPPSRTRCR